jgi:hypothetical protein
LRSLVGRLHPLPPSTTRSTFINKQQCCLRAVGAPQFHILFCLELAPENCRSLKSLLDALESTPPILPHPGNGTTMAVMLSSLPEKHETRRSAYVGREGAGREREAPSDVLCEADDLCRCFRRIGDSSTEVDDFLIRHGVGDSVREQYQEGPSLSCAPRTTSALLKTLSNPEPTPLTL